MTEWSPHETNPPRPTRQGLRLAVAAAFALLVSALGGALAVRQVEQPAYLATALVVDEACEPAATLCVAADVNVLVYADGRRQIARPRPGAEGHAALPEWVLPLGPLPDGVARAVGSMGWPVGGFAREILSGQRPMRYCDEGARAFDPQIAAEMVRATLDKVERLVAVQPSVRDCSATGGGPDLVLTADAVAVCGQGALGCAAVRNNGARWYVNVSVDGPNIGPGRRYPLAAAYAIQLHEVGHAFDMSHAGPYGGEERSHFDLFGHASDLDAICISGAVARSCSNPTGAAAVADWYVRHGSDEVRFGGRLRGPPPEPPPPPPPPTAPPTASPTAPPRPPAGCDACWATGFNEGLAYGHREFWERYYDVIWCQGVRWAGGSHPECPE